jgi:hypothetical protein
MALKAYKHLTDGEVKIVNEGSAEETSLLADTVTGSSYLQLTSTGHAQEVAAAQGTALWVDVTSDLGGSSFAHLSENTDDTRLEADWLLWFGNGTGDPTLAIGKQPGENWLSIIDDFGYGVRITADGTGAFGFTGTHTLLTSDGVVELMGFSTGSELLKLGVAGETNHRVFLNPTSIRFTNGSEVGGGAEAKIRREVVGGKIQLIATVGSTDVVLATEP